MLSLGKSECFESLDHQLSSLPLVSVIVVNYNYGAYLPTAMDSIFAQTYSNIEYIVVDNASTDDSANILRALKLKRPSLKVIQRADNGGQSVAMMDGFEASSGEYVVFVDADDFLLPHCIETHIFVHLSLRIPVGFSSGDMVQLAEDRVVTGTMSSLSGFIQKAPDKTINLIRGIDRTLPDIWPFGSPSPDIAEEIYFVPPQTLPWVWAPTSGNCFRREALDLFLRNPRLNELRSCTDGYLLRAINVITGSVLIDRPLAAYRLHTKNVYSRHCEMNGLLSFERNGPSDANDLCRKLIVDYLVENGEFFLHKLPSSSHYFQALKTVQSEWPRLHSAHSDSYVASQLFRHFSSLAKHIGTTDLMWIIWRFGSKPLGILNAYRDRNQQLHDISN